MDGVDRLERRKSLTERLGFKNMGCCGATWGFRASAPIVRDDEEEEGPQEEEEEEEEGNQLEEEEVEVVDVGQTPPAATTPDHGCVGQTPGASGMNLATALAAERNYRAAQDSDGGSGAVSPVGPTNNQTGILTAGTAPGTPLRVSLMRLLVETDGGDGNRESTAEKEEGGGGVGCDSVCCVCMGRKKGAAFIPCGHTFCRVCSRELWLNRGSCPLCNRLILEILDIF